MSAAVTLIDLRHASKQQATSAHVQVASSPTNSNDASGEAAQQSASASSGTDLLTSSVPSIVSLPDPSNGDERDYLVIPTDNTTKHRSSADPAANAARAVDIYEVQSCTGPSKYGSYFVGSRVVSDGALRVATRVDPLFFVLAAVEAKTKQDVDNAGSDPNKAKNGPRWQPLNQLLADVAPSVIDALRNASTNASLSPEQIIDKQMRNLFHMTDQYGDDFMLYKFDEKLALGWLTAKYDRGLHAAKASILRALLRDEVEKTEAAKLGGGGGAFSSAFNMGDDEDDEKEEDAKAVAITQSSPSSQGSTASSSPTSFDGAGDVAMLSKEDEARARVAALQLVCEYLSDGWRNKLMEELSMTEEDLLGPRGKKRKAAPSTNEDDNDRIDLDADEDMTKPPSKWDSGNDAGDKLQQIARGVDGCGGAAGSANAVMMDEEEREKAKKKEEKLNAKSVGLKKLAKVNTKGMKSLSSFFGGAAKKKKRAQ